MAYPILIWIEMTDSSIDCLSFFLIDKDPCQCYIDFDKNNCQNEKELCQNEGTRKDAITKSLKRISGKAWRQSAGNGTAGRYLQTDHQSD